MKMYGFAVVSIVNNIVFTVCSASEIRPVLIENTAYARMITADTIEAIALYYHDIAGIVYGEVLGVSQVGRYVLKEKYYCIKELSLWEETIGDGSEYKQDLDAVLVQAKIDCSNIIYDLLSVCGPAPIMVMLIEALCWHYQKLDCLLLDVIKNYHENQGLIDERVISFKELESLYKDLLTFLNELVKQYPRACHDVMLRKAKWSKVKGVLLHIISSEPHCFFSPHKEERFMRYIKTHCLDKISFDDITDQKIRSIIMDFDKQCSRDIRA